MPRGDYAKRYWKYYHKEIAEGRVPLSIVEYAKMVVKEQQKDLMENDKRTM